MSQSTAAVQRADRWRAANRIPPNPPMKPRRTFADFQAIRSPHLDFMVLNHNVSSLHLGYFLFLQKFPNSLSFLKVFP